MLTTIIRLVLYASYAFVLLFATVCIFAGIDRISEDFSIASLIVITPFFIAVPGVFLFYQIKSYRNKTPLLPDIILDRLCKLDRLCQAFIAKTELHEYSEISRRREEKVNLRENMAASIPWQIGGPIQNSAVCEYIARTLENGESAIATVLGIGEKTSGMLFGKEGGIALGGSYLLVTDRSVVVIKSGVGSWATSSFGVKTKTYMYDHISSIDVSKGVLFGEIEVVSGGMIEKNTGGFLAGARRDAVVQFQKIHFDAVQQLAAHIRQLATAARHPVVSSPVHQDIPDKIRKLSELKDSGILTADEFETKKRELLQKL
jgi:hypothetical protein